MKDLDSDALIKHLADSAEKDYLTMLNLFESNDYNWSLFIGHIVIEKYLKACIVKATGKHAPFSHDLLKLAKQTSLALNEEMSDQLDAITLFNINSRYDSYKHDFYKMCTKEFTTEWIGKIKKLHVWIRDKLFE